MEDRPARTASLTRPQSAVPPQVPWLAGMRSERRRRTPPTEHVWGISRAQKDLSAQSLDLIAAGSNDARFPQNLPRQPREGNACQSLDGNPFSSVRCRRHAPHPHRVVRHRDRVFECEARDFAACALFAKRFTECRPWTRREALGWRTFSAADLARPLDRASSPEAAPSTSGNSHIPAINRASAPAAPETPHPRDNPARNESPFFCRAAFAAPAISPRVAHNSTTGQVRHAGARGVHTVAPVPSSPD